MRLFQELAHIEDHHLSLGHVLGFAFQKLDAAGGALGVGAAGVHDVDPGILLDSQNQALAFLHVEGPHAVHLQLRHWSSLRKRGRPATRWPPKPPTGLARSNAVLHRGPCGSWSRALWPLLPSRSGP